MRLFMNLNSKAKWFMVIFMNDYRMEREVGSRDNFGLVRSFEIL